MCGRVLRAHVHPLLKRHQAAALSVQTPPGSPFEENRVKLLISVRFIRGTEATGGFGWSGKVEANQSARGEVGGGAVPQPPPQGQL